MKAHREVIRPYVEGRVVHDLGCGDCNRARFLLALGASTIIGVDKNVPTGPLPPNLEFRNELFRDFSDPVETAFVSWPINHHTGLEHILDRAKVIIYLGCNTDGTMCGVSPMWEMLRGREVLQHVPRKRETLIVYGPERIRRPVLPEEYASLQGSDFYLSFESALEHCGMSAAEEAS